MYDAYQVLAESGGLDFFKRESTSEPLLDVVFECRAPDDGPQGLEGTGCNTGSLGSSGLAPAFFASGLVEPGLDITIPIFVEVRIGHHLVTFGRHDEAVSPVTKYNKMINFIITVL